MCELSIIIVSWNASALVRQCLSSIQQSCRELDPEVILVDNASSDGTPEMAAREFPEVILVRNSQNLGFARANNIGMKIARGKYLALINSDVTVLPHCLESLVHLMQADAAIGIAGPRMLTPAGAAGQSCMRRPSLLIWLTHALGLASVCKRYSLHIAMDGSQGPPQTVDVLNGWFWVVRRTALDKAGLLDERFFMYGEDIEWCDRFRKSGWKVVYDPRAASIHHGEGSSSRDPVRFYVEMQRARLQYWKLTHNPLSRAAYLMVFLLHHFVRVCGYGLISALKPAGDRTALFKVKRSAACICWLFRVRGRQAAAISSH